MKKTHLESLAYLSDCQVQKKELVFNESLGLKYRLESRLALSHHSKSLVVPSAQVPD